MINAPKFWWDTPLPFRKDPRSFMLFVLLFFLYLIIFLGLYRPFFLQVLDSQDLGWVVLRTSLFTALLLPSSYAIVTTFFKKQMVSWHFGREIIWSVFHFVIIGLYNIFLFRQIDALYSVSNATILLATCLVGVIPAVIDAGIRFKKPNGRTKMTVISSVLYVKSDGNYIHVYRSESGGVKRDVQRTPLNNFQKQHKSGLVQVHKSFLVNSSVIKNVQGNSNGGIIMLMNDLSIPYSRGFYKNVKPLAS